MMDWDGAYLEPEYPLPEDGNFKEPITFKFVFNDPVTNESYRVDYEVASFGKNGESFSSFYKTLTPVDNTQKKVDSKVMNNQSGSSLPYFLLMAFIGGLILNVMPCVLPVLSIKLLSILKKPKERSLIRKSFVITSTGIVSSFMLLALIFIILRLITFYFTNYYVFFKKIYNLLYIKAFLDIAMMSIFFGLTIFFNLKLMKKLFNYRS